MAAKSTQLQIRVTPRQKAALKRAAVAAGLDVSSYVLTRVLPAESDRFAEIVKGLAIPTKQRFGLAVLSDFLRDCAPNALGTAVARADLRVLSPFAQNYVAAMVEVAASQKGVSPPAWVDDIEPLDEPYFATPLPGLRLHLLLSAPVPFKRRNIFIDATVGDRV